MTHPQDTRMRFLVSEGGLRRFLDARACRAWLLERLHPHGAACPECGVALANPKQAVRFMEMETVRCQQCGRSFNGLSGTPFRRIQLQPVDIVALLLLLQFSRGAAEIASQMGVDERTVRRWRNRFRDLPADFSPRAAGTAPVPDAGEAVPPLVTSA